MGNELVCKGPQNIKNAKSCTFKKYTVYLSYSTNYLIFKNKMTFSYSWTYCFSCLGKT